MNYMLRSVGREVASDLSKRSYLMCQVTTNKVILLILKIPC